MDKHRVVIIGGGFGGVYTAKTLSKSIHRKKLEVILIDKENYFLFTPLLHEVATGGLSPLSVTLPLREIFSKACNVSVMQDEVLSVDLEEKQVVLKDRSVEFDSVVFATGAKTNFRNTEGARGYTLPLKNLLDAALIRNTIINNFEKAVYEKDKKEKKKLLTFVVVGGGATGIEFACELADFVKGTLLKYYPLSNEDKELLSVKLVVSGNEVLKQFPDESRKITQDKLIEKGVDIIFNRKASLVDGEGLKLSEGERIDSKAVIWTAGIEPQNVSGESHMKVQKSLKLEGYDSAYAIGDVAVVSDKYYPDLAQVAVEQAFIVAYNIERSLLNQDPVDFDYKIRGMLASLGQWMAVGNVFGRNISGRFAWWLWRTIYLFKFPSWRKRIKVALEWTINLFYPRDITKI